MAHKPLKSPQPKECIFCGAQAKLTGEHIHADWLAPYIPSGDAFAHTTSQSIENATAKFGRHVARKGMLHKRGNVKKVTLKIVCNTCNTGWMSRLQEQVKPILLPMLEGGWREVISRWDRRILAAWATMYTMVVEFADPDTQTASFDERERFRLNPEPPPGWYVWISLHDGPLWTLGANHLAWSTIMAQKGTLDPIAWAARKKEVQCTGWVVGPLYFQTLSSCVPGFKMDELAFAKKHSLRVVWPSDGLPIECPIRVLDDIDAHNAFIGPYPPVARTPIRRAWESY